MDFEIGRLSSKGQIVIPTNLRKGFNEGERLIILRDGDNIVLKKASEFDEKLREDLEFARRTQEAWKEIEAGKYTKSSVKDFLKEIKSLK